MLKMAIPNKGRLFEKTIELLENSGFNFDISKRKLFTIVDNYNLEIIFTRTDDIPIYIEKNIVDIGITGEDIVKEHDSNIASLLQLGYGKCKMIVAAPKNKFKDINSLPNSVKLATSFPNISKKFFDSKNIKSEIADIHGAVEISPRLGLADVIVDITSSGDTLRMNDLEIIATLFSSQATLFANKNSLNSRKKEIDYITNAIESVLLAHKKKYLMANISKEKLDSIKDQLPSIKAPTILPLSGNDDNVAIHTVIDENEVNKVVNLLKINNATGILIFNIERMFN